MLRSQAITAIEEFLTATYFGPVAIHSAESTEVMAPPYAIVRVGSSENIGGGQYDIWEFNVLVGVFHDADATPPAEAQTQAAEIFEALADPAAITTALAPEIIVSHWERSTVEASIEEFRWQHIAGFQLVAAPAE